MTQATFTNCDKDCFPLQNERPASEEEIISRWENWDQPLVSICCATYNHAGEIEDAIKGFLGQKTDFPFEIIIRDDASIDGTGDIVNEYATKYPRLIKAIINPENMFVKGERPIHVWPSVVSGDFVAYCEGDDFWIAENKLQKQVALLRHDPDCSIAVAGTHWYEKDGPLYRFLKTTGTSDANPNGYYHTSTFVIRSSIFKDVVEKYFIGHCQFGDTALRAILETRGRTTVLPEAVSVYRLTNDGIWTSLDDKQKLFWEHDVASRLAKVLPAPYSKKYRFAKQKWAYQIFRQSVKQGRWFDGIKYLPGAIRHMARGLVRRLKVV